MPTLASSACRVDDLGAGSRAEQQASLAVVEGHPGGGVDRLHRHQGTLVEGAVRRLGHQADADDAEGRAAAVAPDGVADADVEHLRAAGADHRLVVADRPATVEHDEAHRALHLVEGVEGDVLALDRGREAGDEGHVRQPGHGRRVEHLVHAVRLGLQLPRAAGPGRVVEGVVDPADQGRRRHDAEHRRGRGREGRAHGDRAPAPSRLLEGQAGPHGRRDGCSGPRRRAHHPRPPHPPAAERGARREPRGADGHARRHDEGDDHRGEQVARLQVVAEVRVELAGQPDREARGQHVRRHHRRHDRRADREHVGEGQAGDERRRVEAHGAQDRDGVGLGLGRADEGLADEDDRCQCGGRGEEVERRALHTGRVLDPLDVLAQVLHRDVRSAVHLAAMCCWNAGRSAAPWRNRTRAFVK